jgi:hypothetical protein
LADRDFILTHLCIDRSPIHALGRYLILGDRIEPTSRNNSFPLTLRSPPTIPPQSSSHSDNCRRLSPRKVSFLFGRRLLHRAERELHAPPELFSRMPSIHHSDPVQISRSGMTVPGAEGNETNPCAQREEQIRQNAQELFACLQAIPTPVKPLNRRKDPSFDVSRVNDADILTPSFRSGRCEATISKR